MKKLISVFIVSWIFISVHAQNQADSAFYSTKESKWLTNKAGAWNVVMFLQPTIDAKPVQIKGLTAERSMIGALCLHDIMQRVKGAPMPLFKRTADLDFNLNDDCWDYMSIDTRITAGLMYFTYFQHAGDSIVSYIMHFPHPGLGPQMADRGKCVRCRNVVLDISQDHDMIKQYWRLTDGTVACCQL